MSNNARSQGILPFQMNIDLLAKVFPMLNTDPAESINVSTNETKLATDASKTIVLVGTITNLTLPNPDNVGLTYKVQNNTDHDVTLQYTFTNTVTGNDETVEFKIHPDQIWAFFWNGKRWVPTDYSIEEIITDPNYEFTPAVSKVVLFNLENDFVFNLQDCDNAGVELQFINKSETGNVHIRYKNHGTRDLWLPPKSKYIGDLKWNGENWENHTKDEWYAVIPQPEESEENDELTEEESTQEVTYPIRKDINDSILHIVTNGNDNSKVEIDNSNLGAEIECIIDDPDYVDSISFIKIIDEDHRVTEKFNTSLSSALPSVTIKFDGKHNGEFDFIPVKSSGKGYIKSSEITGYSICGIHNDIIIDISRGYSPEAVLLSGHQTGTSADTIPIGTKMYLRNYSAHTVHIKVNTVDTTAGNENLDTYIGVFDIKPKEPLTLIYNGYAFTLYDQPMIGSTFAAPIDGHILRPVQTWTHFTEDSLKTIRIMKNSKFQMESATGKPYTYIAEVNTDLVFNETLSDYVGKDVYVYLVAGITSDDEVCQFKFSTLLPEAFQLWLTTQYSDYADTAVSMIVGGFHVGVMRKTTGDFIPIKSNTLLPPVSETADDWADYTKLDGDAAWIQNTCIGIIPNTIWDISHRPTCYDISRTDRQLGGMMKVGTIWVDLYKTSGKIDRAGGGNGPMVEFRNIKSAYGELPITDMDYFTAVSLASAIGKRLLKRSEWLAMAAWTPGNNKTSDYAPSDDSNLRCGCCIDSNGEYDPNGSYKYAVSAYNAYNCVGHIGEIVDCTNYADAGAGAWAWASNNGSDYFGQSYTPNGKETAVIMGGDYETLTPGPRTADVHIETAEHNSKIGVRFCCDSTL